MNAEALLPGDLLARGSLYANEYAWSVHDLPLVIEAARQANVLNVGGCLQFRFDGSTCECYWIDVDTYKDVPASLAWLDRVERAANVALARLEALRKDVDFLSEGRKAFAEHFAAYEARGGDIERAACFVWYLLTQQQEADRA